MKRALVLVAALCACSTSASSAQPGKFAPQVTNPWYPLKPGTTFVYTGEKDGKPGRVVTAVTHATKVIRGVRCTAIDDRLYHRGYLAERTTDWYAQDKQGTVWYLGEKTAELNAHGKVTSTEGSFMNGREGASGGIFMPARPAVGQSFQQEAFKGQAEDHFRILSLATSITTPAISSNGAMLTEETTPLERGVIDHKFYVRGVGTVKEQQVAGGPASQAEEEHLVSFTPGSG
jgi:hypothetical protein